MSIGYQYFSLLMPALYTATVLSRRRLGATWSINGLLRATWVGGAFGTVQGGALEYLRTTYESRESMRKRRVKSMYNVSGVYLAASPAVLMYA